MTPPPGNEFGKRLPRLPPNEPPVQQRKRSGNIALLLMGTAAIGGRAYTLMPRETCDPNRPVLAADQPADCRQGSTSSTRGGHGGSSGGSSSSRSSESGRATTVADTGHTTRGGFGSFMSHFSGGG